MRMRNVSSLSLSHHPLAVGATTARPFQNVSGHDVPAGTETHTHYTTQAGTQRSYLAWCKVSPACWQFMQQFDNIKVYYITCTTLRRGQTDAETRHYPSSAHKNGF